MQYEYLLNKEGTALLSKDDVNILSSFLSSRYRAGEEEFKKAITVIDCPFAQEGYTYDFIGVGCITEDLSVVDEVILCIRYNGMCGIGILDKSLNFRVIIEPAHIVISYNSNRCIEVRKDVLTLYYRGLNETEFEIIDDVSALSIDLNLAEANENKMLFVVYYRGEDIVCGLLKGKRPDGVVFTDELPKDALKELAQDILGNTSNNFNENTKYVLRLLANLE